MYIHIYTKEEKLEFEKRRGINEGEKKVYGHTGKGMRRVKKENINEQRGKGKDYQRG